MSLKRRTIDPEMYQHPTFRTASYFNREVWIGLIVSATDDDGRFRANPLLLLESMFSRAHDATVADITAALQFWQDEDWLILYGDHLEYGFLTGWYEHQYIDNRYREASGLPAPPVVVNSWEIADKINAWACEKRGKKRVTMKTSLRDFYACAAREQTAIIGGSRTRTTREKQPRRTRAEHVEQPPRTRDAQGLELELEDEKEDDAPPASRGWQIPDDLGPVVQNVPITSGELDNQCPHWTRPQKQRWLYDAAQSIASPAGKQAHLTDKLLAEEIAANIPANSSKGDWYADKLIDRLRRESERNGGIDARAEPDPKAPERARLQKQLEQAFADGDNLLASEITGKIQAL